MESRIEHSFRKALKGVRLLVVEDDAILLMELEEILQEAGATDVSCATPSELHQSGAGNSVAGSPAIVCHAIAASTMTAPAIANGAGRSPRNNSTQIGLEIGSSIPVSEACVAVTYLRPFTKSVYASAI